MKFEGNFLFILLVALLTNEARCSNSELPGVGFGKQSPLSLLPLGAVFEATEVQTPSESTLKALATNREFLGILKDVIPRVKSQESNGELLKILEKVSLTAHDDESEQVYQARLQILLQVILSDNPDKILKSPKKELPQWVIDAIINIIMNNLTAITEAIKKLIFGFVERILSEYYLPIGEGVSEECRNASLEVFDHLKSLWALQMVDSWGKFPDGFLFGNVHVMGMYEECIHLEANYSRESGEIVEYTGRYCSVAFSMERNPGVRSGIAIAELLPVGFAYGTCIPSMCTSEDMLISLNETVSDQMKEAVRVNCHGKEDGSPELSPLSRLMTALLIIILILVLIGTVFDSTMLLMNKNWNKGFGKILINFSFFHNFRGVFTYKERPAATTITCLPGMRVITLTWIIIGHQYEAGALFLANTFDVLKYQDPVPGQIVTNGWFAVDTFLCLTGCVLAFRIFPHVKIEAGSGNFILFGKTFVRRFFRLAPSIFIVALFSASLIRYLGLGPNSYQLWQYSERCEKHWWKDTLFINNYIIGENEGYNINDCLHHCWYTAVDMQLLLILPIILVPIAAHKKLGGLLFCMIFIGSMIIPMSIIVAHDLPPLPFHLMGIGKQFEYMWRVSAVPWCRAGPWLAGIGTGLLLRDPKISKIKIPKFVAFCLYLFAIGMGLTILMSMYPFNHVIPDKDYRDYPALNAAYGALARPLWGVCLGLVILCCQTGNSNIVNRILSYPGWRPLGRLTFSMYLLTPVIQVWWSTSRLMPTYFNYQEKLFQILGVTFIGGLIGIFLTCFVERPICSFLNMIMPSDAVKTEAAIAKGNHEPEKHELLPVDLPMTPEQVEIFKVPRASISPAASPFHSPPPHPMYEPAPYSTGPYPPLNTPVYPPQQGPPSTPLYPA